MEEFVNEPYVPSELVNCSSNAGTLTYHCYLIELKQNYDYDVSVHDIVLAMRSELDSEIGIANTQFELSAELGSLSVKLRQVESIELSPDEVQKCRRFQTTLFRILLGRNKDRIMSAIVSEEFGLGDNPEIDYLLLPATVKHQRPSNPIVNWKSIFFIFIYFFIMGGSPSSFFLFSFFCFLYGRKSVFFKHQRPSNSIVDWKSIFSVPFSSENTCECEDHGHGVWTKNGLVCSCKLRNCVVTTPHNDSIYIIDGVTDLNGNSRMLNGDFDHQSLLRGRNVFRVSNYLLKCRQQRKQKGSSTMFTELPPELCSIIMSPISISTIYSFTFIPSIMHRLESLLIAFSLKKMLSQHDTQKDIPIFKILQAITTKECQEDYDYQSLETLGDSFLKYAVSQQLFKTNQNLQEGQLTDEKNKITSNPALFKWGCSHRLPGFIRKGSFNPKQWIIPGDKSKCLSLKEEFFTSTTRVYVCGRKRKIKFKVVADVVEALIGAFLSTGPRGEEAALSFMNWIGINADTNIIPYESKLYIPPEKLVNVTLLESLLNYSFEDPSLLVEALTHGSLKRSGFPCYERLKFLGDAVLDCLITQHFYEEYCDVSSGFLTVMRSISVNNECYALSAIKARLHEHILHNSKDLDKQIPATVNEVKKLSLKSTFGWELETSFPNVLADVIESLAGAIFVDSGYNKEAVFQSIRPLLEPLVTPETARLHPVVELHELCQRENYERKEPCVSREYGVTLVTIEVKAKGITHKRTAKAANEKTAEKLASKEVLKLLKEPKFKRRRFLFHLLTAVFFLFCWFYGVKQERLQNNPQEHVCILKL